MLFHVLGPLEVHGPVVHRLGAGKPAVVLATLLLEPNAWVPVDRLVETVWPEPAAPASAVANLKTYVWKLRRMLPDGATRIERRADAYRLRVAPDEVDADRVAARANALAGAPATALTLVEEALGWWRGRPYAGIATPAADAAAARLDDLRLTLREEQAALQLALGRADDAVATLRLVTAEAPLRETAWARLVRALHATGRRSEALLGYRRAAAILEAELGVAPGADLAAAYRAAAGTGRARVPRRELPPDPGPAGRAAERAAVLRPAPVTVVTGLPGVGKTALVVHAAHALAAHFPDGQYFVDLHGSASVSDLPGGGSLPDPHRRGSLPDLTGGGSLRDPHGRGPVRPVTPAEALGVLLRRAGVPAADVPESLDERIALWRSETAGRRILLVLDDAACAAQVAPLLPATPDGRILITTRRRDRHPAGAARVALEPLAAAAAAGLFADAAGVAVGDPGVAAVVRHCGGLPAALLDAAERLRSRPGWTVRALAAELDADPCRVLRDACRRLDGAAADPDPDPARFSDAERRTADGGGVVWRALGVLPERFDAAAAGRVLGVPAADARAALEALVDRGLLDTSEPGIYRSHPLVRHVAACGSPAVRPLPDRHRAA